MAQSTERVKKSVGLTPEQRETYRDARERCDASAAEVDEAVIGAEIERRGLTWPSWDRRRWKTRSGRRWLETRVPPRRGQKYPHVTTWTREQWAVIERALGPDGDYAAFFTEAHRRHMERLFGVGWPVAA